MTTAREMMRAMDELVTGEGGWEHAGGVWEVRLGHDGKALFRRCCGTRMTILRKLYRYKDAKNYPADSRRARQWWGDKWGWVCETCGLREQKTD